MRLVLASQSPRRSELLRVAGFSFDVRSRPVEEVRGPGEAPRDYALRLARAKAQASWQGDAWEGGDEVVLGADTIVVLGDLVLEKPVDADDARRMLEALSGRSHTVITGICLRHRRGAILDGESLDGEILDSESTLVHFTELDAEEIDRYVASGEPMDKAGAYGIQGLASKFINRIEGCYFNVMGLPLARFYRHWKTLESGA